MAQDELDTLTNEIEQGFMQRGGWKSCRYLLGKLLDCRAGKLLMKGKPFIVVAHDEPYFTSVYLVIREAEKHKGRWTADCERTFQEATRYDHEGEFPKATPELASILRDQRKMNELQGEVNRLTALCAKLPTTADGATIEPGATVWQ